MPEPLDDFIMTRSPTPDRPLLGQTVLVVEDSRFASEAMRLLCLRSGARIRRADSLRAAARHLAVYLPTVAVVDLGLPDGSGLELIGELANACPRVGVIMASSADDDASWRAIEVGADGFLPKPINSLAAFQDAILEHIPLCDHPRGLRLVNKEEISPDRIALRDDLAHVAEVLAPGAGPDVISYVAQFVAGLAKSSGDTGLAEAAERLRTAQLNGARSSDAVTALRAAIGHRLKTAPIV